MDLWFKTGQTYLGEDIYSTSIASIASIALCSFNPISTFSGNKICLNQYIISTSLLTNKPYFISDTVQADNLEILAPFLFSYPNDLSSDGL